MTQPSEAVGGATNEPVAAAEPTIEDRFAARAADMFPDEDKEPEEAENLSDEPETGYDEGVDASEEGETEGEAEDPPIAAPVSWTAEEKEEFKNLPRAIQETLTRREAEREKFVQSKAQQEAKTRLNVEQQAAEWRTAKLTSDAQLLAEMLPELPERPSHLLQVEDPYGYAQQMEWFDSVTAQRNAIAQRYEAIQAEVGQVQQTIKQQQAALTARVLEENFKEFLDPDKGPELKQQLRSTALSLGYSEDQLANVDGQDILAMRQANDWRTKAEKYDALMAKQMEKVREAKSLPRVSRPGAPQARGAAAGQRLAADRQAMRNGDSDAAARVFGRHLR